MALIFDIETVGYDFDSLDKTSKYLLTRWIEREAGGNRKQYAAFLKDVKNGLGFSPLTGEIVAIGVYDDIKNKGVVYFQSPNREIKEFKQENFIFRPKTEIEMLKSFWRGALKYNLFVSFNGRSFDIPFLMIRSAIHKLRPAVNLMTGRYLNEYQKIKHIDLYDQFSFYGAVRRRGNLHLYCRAFGIHSPKAEGISGDDINDLFRRKKYKEIAEYNSWDLIATNELYQKWQKYLNFN